MASKIRRFTGTVRPDPKPDVGVSPTPSRVEEDIEEAMGGDDAEPMYDADDAPTGVKEEPAPKKKPKKKHK